MPYHYATKPPVLNSELDDVCKSFKAFYTHWMLFFLVKQFLIDAHGNAATVAQMCVLL